MRGRVIISGPLNLNKTTPLVIGKKGINTHMAEKAWKSTAMDREFRSELEKKMYVVEIFSARVFESSIKLTSE